MVSFFLDRLFLNELLFVLGLNPGEENFFFTYETISPAPVLFVRGEPIL